MSSRRLPPPPGVPRGLAALLYASARQPRFWPRLAAGAAGVAAAFALLFVGLPALLSVPPAIDGGLSGPLYYGGASVPVPATWATLRNDPRYAEGLVFLAPGSAPDQAPISLSIASYDASRALGEVVAAISGAAGGSPTSSEALRAIVATQAAADGLAVAGEIIDTPYLNALPSATVPVGITVTWATPIPYAPDPNRFLPALLPAGGLPDAALPALVPGADGYLASPAQLRLVQFYALPGSTGGSLRGNTLLVVTLAVPEGADPARAEAALRLFRELVAAVRG